MSGVGSEEYDRTFMARALELARLGWGHTAPNPMVGAVLVRDGVCVGEGYHARFGGPHAEVVALAQAGERARGATLYVTLEPCAHFGKTPPCTEAIVAAGVSRVVAALGDPNPLAAGGLRALASHGIATNVGALSTAAAELNAAYVHSFVSQRPWITLKLAVTLEGAIADATDTTSSVTGSAARAFAHALRAGSDAVAVGMGTVRVDDPLLTVRDASPPRVAPARVVFSRDGCLSLTSRLARTVRDAPVIVAATRLAAATRQALHDAGVETLVAADLAALCLGLRARGLRSVLVEGGAQLASALLNAGLVDRLILIQAPVLFGHGALNAFAAVHGTRAAEAARWRVVRRLEVGDDLVSEFAVREL